MKPNTQCECMNDKCRTVTIGNGKRIDGLYYPRCNGPVIPKLFSNCNKKEKLLVIELDSYDSVPKVILNGAEVKGGKVSVRFDWKTKDIETPKTVPSFDIEYLEKEDGLPVIKSIAFDDRFN